MGARAATKVATLALLAIGLVQLVVHHSIHVTNNAVLSQTVYIHDTYFFSILHNHTIVDLHLNNLLKAVVARKGFPVDVLKLHPHPLRLTNPLLLVKGAVVLECMERA